MFSPSCRGPGRALERRGCHGDPQSLAGTRGARASAAAVMASIETGPRVQEHVRAITEGRRRRDSCNSFPNNAIRTELPFGRSPRQSDGNPDGNDSPMCARQNVWNICSTPGWSSVWGLFRSQEQPTSHSHTRCTFTSCVRRLQWKAQKVNVGQP